VSIQILLGAVSAAVGLPRAAGVAPTA